MKEEKFKYPTIIGDNFFNNLNEKIKISKELKYYKPKKNDNWPGLRTESIHTTHPELFHAVVMKILSYYYPNTFIKFGNTSLVFSKIKKEDKSKSHFHYDVNSKLAGLIYLSEGDLKSGTTLFNDNKKKQVIISNDINTMIVYDAMKYHGITNLNVLEERLTINFFIREINI